MRCLAILVCAFGLGGSGFAQTTNAPPSAPNTLVVDGVTVPADIVPLYQKWESDQHDPAERAAAAGDLMEAIIHSNVDEIGVVADVVSRDGLPLRLLSPPAAKKVALTPLVTLDGAHMDKDYPPGCLYRRIADDRFEAWTSGEGWLFNAKGRVLAHVKVPRRDGTGREWFGAFLPDGTWITTDLWEQDEQLNAFDATGKWLWELKGADILAQLPPTGDKDDADTPAKPLICWARANRIGQGWIVCVGENWNTTTALVAENKAVGSVPGDQTVWDMVHPRAMGVRGFYTELGISSDDGKAHLSRSEPAHGPGVGWPRYAIAPGGWSRVVREGNWEFGFWPKSHATYMEAYGKEYTGPHRVWFFDEAGRYAGEIAGSRLGDSATGRGLLVTTPDDCVATVLPGAPGPSATQVRDFTWPDGSRAIPVALYDDLHLGFFLRGPGMEAPGDDARRARSTAQVVLAKWQP